MGCSLAFAECNRALAHPRMFIVTVTEHYVVAHKKKKKKLAGKEGKAIMYDDTFWDKLDSLFPKYGKPGGCQLDPPYVTGGVAMKNPVHKYLEFVRGLGLHILSWRPKNVERRDEWGLACYRRHFALGLPISRYGIATHIFFFDWTGAFADMVMV